MNPGRTKGGSVRSAQKKNAGSSPKRNTTRKSASSKASTLSGSIDGFELIDLLGSGAMGMVYRAYDPLLHRIVAVKVLKNDQATSDSSVAAARFLAEATLTGRLTHAGIIPIYRVGFDGAHGFYYCMRYVVGKTFDQVLRVRRAMGFGTNREYTIPRMVNILLRVCEAAAFAHRNGIVHRDLKPSNIMITDSNETLVMDWGVAKDVQQTNLFADVPESNDHPSIIERCNAVHRQRTVEFLQQYTQGSMGSEQTGTPVLSAEDLTMDGESIGTPAYMSPEQVDGSHELSSASDMYSLGVILYQTLSGRLPIEEKNLDSMLRKVSEGDIIPITDRAEAFRLPRVLCNIVQRCLQRNPADRYQHAGELAADLQLFQEGSSPLRKLVDDNFVSLTTTSAEFLEHGHWNMEGGIPRLLPKGLYCEQGCLLSNRSSSPGDFVCDIQFSAATHPWCLSVIIGKEREQTIFMSHHEIRIGVDERPCVELFTIRGRMQRRFDCRLQSHQRYTLSIELEEEFTRIRLDGTPLLTYREIFPQTGGNLTIHARKGNLILHGFEWLSRGAPLRLSYQFLPDEYFRLQEYQQALELYLQLAESHPDREEGLMALYKAGLCFAELRQTTKAFDVFSKLEGTMLDHYCALGFARIGMLDNNIEWAWEALKSAYLRHHHPSIRNDMWFSLLNLLEYIDDVPQAKMIKYRELLAEIDATPEELSQITFEYLVLCQSAYGLRLLRQEARELIQMNPDKPGIATEALLTLWYNGLDEENTTLAESTVDKLLKSPISELYIRRLLLLKAELQVGQECWDEARTTLNKALAFSAGSRPEQSWARNWILLTGYLHGDYTVALQEAYNIMNAEGFSISGGQSYCYLLLSLVLLRTGKRKLAEASIRQVRHESDTWARIIDAILDNKPPNEIADRALSPNVESEALLLAGEAHALLGHRELARTFFTACDNHPNKRYMTRKLSEKRLEEL